MPNTRTVLFAGLLAVGLVLSASPTDAQLRRPSAELTPAVQPQAVHAGETVSGELRVELPDGIHVQSDNPREDYLIPTRLTFALPEGVTVEEITYPPASDWFLEGQEEPLAVFETEFTVRWRLALGPEVPAGRMVVPASFQYQSCDDRLCYPPVTAPVEWRLSVERP
jgi:DsbC/DsbD-like thiol-disulfide interchange protein